MTPRFAEVIRECGSLWQYLSVRVRGRTAVQLERERNAATATAIRLLPPGARLLESEAGGRLRLIEMPQAPVANPVITSGPEPGSPGELL